MVILEWRGDSLSLRPATLDDVPGIVALYRELECEAGPAGDSPISWFSLGGPWMHEHYCSRHVQAYDDLGWDCWVVERNGESIVGSVEICYAAEPEPFGRYGHLEILEADDDLLGGEVEHWILEQCESRARARGFDKFWCRPVGSGGSWNVLAERGYVERWKNGWLTIRGLDRIEAPAFHEQPLVGDYDSEASHLLALNHRESASYRWRLLWRPVLTPEASDFPTRISFSGRRIALPDRPPANVLLNIWSWRDPQSAWADIWVEPRYSTDSAYISDLVAVAGQKAFSMEAGHMNVVVPEPLSDGVAERFEAERVPLERGEPWLMKDLRD